MLRSLRTGTLPSVRGGVAPDAVLPWSTPLLVAQLPLCSVTPVASGTVLATNVLSVTDGTWTGSPTITYQWTRNGVAIAAATNATYTAVLADEGPIVVCLVTATTAAGAITLASNSLQAVPVNSVAPVASGTVAAGQVLSCTTGTWSNSPAYYTYQWQRGGVDINGATSATYTAVTADVTGAPDITCDVIAHNLGASAIATSNALVAP